MLAMNLWLSDSEGCLPGPGSLGRKEEVSSWKWLTYQCLESPRTLETEIWEWMAETSLPPYQGPMTPLSSMRLTSGRVCCDPPQISSRAEKCTGRVTIHWAIPESGGKWIQRMAPSTPSYSSLGDRRFLSEGLQQSTTFPLWPTPWGIRLDFERDS